MSFWRKFGLVIAGALLPISLFTWGLLFSSYQMYAGPEKLKAALDNSGIYDTLVSDVLNQVKKEGDQSKEQNIPTDQPEVKQIIERAASPEYLKSQVEGFLDNSYAWIQGESERLELQIDLSGVKTNLTDGLTQLAQNRLATMPACSGVDNAQSFDPLTDECLPRGVDKNVAVEKIRAEINQQFNDPVITQDDINNDGQSLEEKLSAIPTVYSNLVLGLWLSAGLIILCTVAIILLSTQWRTGLKRVGIIFVSVGAISCLLAFAVAFGFKQAAKSLANEGDIQASALNVISLLADGFRGWWLLFGCIVIILGIAAIVVPKFVKPEKANAEQGKLPTDQQKPEKETIHSAKNHTPEKRV